MFQTTNQIGSRCLHIGRDLKQGRADEMRAIESELSRSERLKHILSQRMFQHVSTGWKSHQDGFRNKIGTAINHEVGIVSPFLTNIKLFFLF